MKPDAIQLETIDRMTRTKLEARGRYDLLRELDRSGATVDLDSDGNYRVLVAGEVATTISPLMFAAFERHVRNLADRLN